MQEDTSLPISLGAFMVRTLACLLLAGSLVMLLFPWVSLRLSDGGQRITLREAEIRAGQRSGQSLRESLLAPLGQRDGGLYEGVLQKLDPLLDDRMSPLQTGLSCLRISRWMEEYSEDYHRTAAPDGETERWVQSVRASAGDLQGVGLFMLLMLGMLLLTGCFAVWSSAAGYGFGLLPYALCSVPGLLAAGLLPFRCNAWYQGGSGAAGLLRAAVESFSSAGYPVTSPFRAGLGGILFAVLTATGLLLALCAPRKRQARPAPSPSVPGTAPSPRPAPARREPARPLPGTWRCPNCGTLMGDGVYCVKCGCRKPEPRRCPACGALMQKGSAFCDQCGQALGPVTEPASAAPAGNRPENREDPFVAELYRLFPPKGSEGGPEETDGAERR